ncbi:cytochrome c, partial [Akkermansiaceae bacterium]|nr:cytochrome c [Akkermansiaceae bacterium]
MKLARKSATLLCLLLLPLQGAEEEKPVTFSKDIAPIIYDNCTTCHRPGQIGPFALTDYKTVKRRAKQIVEVTDDRTMPPWHADEGDVNFSNNRSLSPEQIMLLADWVAAGRPEGDPAETPPLPEFHDDWQIGKPDQIATMAEPF